MIDWTPFILSFKLASTTVVILLTIGIPLAWYLVRSQNFIKPILETVVSMPLVLPPTVLGFYIIWMFAPDSLVGKLLNSVGIEPLFSFTGLVFGSVLYSLPFMVQPLQSGFSTIPKSVIEASFVAGKSSWQTLWKVVLPSSKQALLTAIVLTFAHTIGEFGVVLMVGGSIPGKTKVASIAIYEYVEMLDYHAAHIYSVIMVAISFAVLLVVYSYNKKRIF
ncbi:molybdate ABC transporter permease subunit [Nitratiruptor sp. YY09-18]|uniref:molybdate ABC transporter permease subunit n=1 Tax=Nitratiruptor sp. YY09-18 TaxID=2724901 RepID=UPI00191623C8|nr:molybdate ABC transporter permease subunit [Nitratiruptor sp. YY09-18]BCD67299.1 molybdate transport system permease protein [Nitratiruptor sp. YY09-18]